jgi:hypothetical protein
MNCKGLKNLLGLSFYLSSIKLKRQSLMFIQTRKLKHYFIE